MPYVSTLTELGEAAIAYAIQTGTSIGITDVAVGSDGTAHSASATALNAEEWRDAVNSVLIDDVDPNTIVVEAVIPDDDGGYWIREFGLFAGSTLIAIGQLPDSYKPDPAEAAARTQVVRIKIPISNTSGITLTTDPAAVVVTRDYFDPRVTMAYLFPGGTTGQIAAKASGDDGDVEWIDPTPSATTAIEGTVTFATSAEVLTLRTDSPASARAVDVRDLVRVESLLRPGEIYNAEEGIGPFIAVKTAEVLWTARAMTVITNGRAYTIPAGAPVTSATYEALSIPDREGAWRVYMDHTTGDLELLQSSPGATHTLVGGATHTQDGWIGYSAWDLNWRPDCPNPDGMVCVGNGQFWIDVWPTNTNPAVNGGTSVPGVDIAISYVQNHTPPGASAISRYWWNDAIRQLRYYGKRLPTAEECALAFDGVTEENEQASYPLVTGHIADARSSWGVEQATGCVPVWCGHDPVAFADTAETEYTTTGGAGWVGTSNVGAWLAGGRADAGAPGVAGSGSLEIGKSSTTYCASRGAANHLAK